MELPTEEETMASGEECPDAEPETGAVLVEGGLKPGSAARFEVAGQDGLRAEGVPPARAARELQALLRIGQALHAFDSAEPLARRLVELAFDTVPAERSCVLLLDPATGELAGVHGRDREDDGEPFAVSRTLLERVVAERSAVLANDVFQSGGPWRGVGSVVAARIQSLVAVPLPSPEGVLGALYVDTLKPGVRFDERHVEVLATAAAIAGSALAHVRRLEWLRARTAASRPRSTPPWWATAR